MPSKDMDVPVRRVHVSSVQYVACDMYGLLHQMVRDLLFHGADHPCVYVWVPGLLLCSSICHNKANI